MNTLDFAILAAIALYILAGIYKGLVWNLSVLGSYIVAWILALIFMTSVSHALMNNESLYLEMQSYTEGAEYINDVESAKLPPAELSSSAIEEIIGRSALPFPLANRVADNIDKEVYRSRKYTLGDYFNEVIVMFTLNAVSFLLVYAFLRIVFAIGINWYDYSKKFPVLRKHDMLISAGVGLVRGVFALFTLFTLMPIVLTVLPFEQVQELVEGSVFASFFYHSNFLLLLIPAT